MFSRAISRLQPSILRGLGARKSNLALSRAVTRSLVVLSSNNATRDSLFSNLCSCGCGIHGMHTRGDRELVEYLTEQITLEKRNLAPVASHLDDFSISTKDAEITLTKNFHDEKITISLNVNHSVDSDSPAEFQSTEASDANLQSRPSFEVDIHVGSKVLSFTCSFTPAEQTPQEGADQVEDVFGISEVTFYEGEWAEETYCISGDILDEMMYDMFMNMLEERGITEEFVGRLSDLCTQYELSRYVSLMQEIQNFVKRK